MSLHISQRIQFEQIIAGILRMISDVSQLKALLPFINPKLFYPNETNNDVDNLRSILILLKDIEKDRGIDNISPHFIDTQIPIYIKDYEKSSLIRSSFSSWCSNESIQKKVSDDGCYASFVDYIKALQIFEISADLNNHLQKNQVKDAVDKMHTVLYKISKIGHHSAETLEDDEPLKILEMDSRNDVTRKALFLDNPLLDHVLGGFEQQTLNLFIAPTNSGKSMFAHHLVARAVEQKTRVWIGVLEDRKKSFVYRLMSRLSGVPIYRLKREFAHLTAEEKRRVVDANEQIKIYVKAEFLYGCGIEAIHKAALDYDLECKLRGIEVPIVNIVDYTGHIAGHSAGEKTYEKMRIAYGQRKDFALKNDKIAFDFAQINRVGSKDVDNNQVITHKDLAGSYDLAQVGDNIISLNRNSDDIETNASKLHICKARDSGVGITVRVKVDFARALYNMKDYELMNGGEDIFKLNNDLIKAKK